MSELRWEITAKEQKNRSTRSLIKGFGALLVFSLIVLVLSIYSADGCSLIDFKCAKEMFPFTLLLVSLFPLGWLVAYVFNWCYRKPERRYVLGNERLVISKGNRSREYTWDQFTAFYTHRFTHLNETGVKNYHKERGIALEKKIKKIIGETFLLRKKSLLPFPRRFVVIRAEPNNSEQVAEFLKHFLPHEELGEFTDSFAIMEFR